MGLFSLARTATPELETVSVPGVEIIAAGRWNNRDYTRDDLDEMVRAFGELRGKIDPPVKLGHDDGQKLAQKDGYPALGWVDRIYRKGSTLVADLKDVPKRVAKLITAGAYQKVSSEIYFDKEVGGSTYPVVLKAISLLGGDMPAVKDIRSIGDIEGLYDDRGRFVATLRQDEEPEPSATLVFLRDISQDTRDNAPESDFAGKGRSFPILKPEDVAAAAKAIGRAGPGNYDAATLKANIIRIAKRKGPAFVEQLPESWEPSSGEPDADDRKDNDEEPTAAVVGDEVDHDQMINEMRDFMARMEQRIAGRPGAKRLRTFMQTAHAQLKAMSAQNTEGEMEIAKLAEKLGLAADATEDQVTAKLDELAKRPDEDRVSKLTEEVIELKRQARLEKIEALIDSAVKDGKVLPTEREDLTSWATRDFETFEKYIAKRPKLALLSGPIGADGDAGDAPEVPAMPELDRQMGLTKTKVEKFAKPLAELMEENRDRIGSTAFAVNRG